MSDVLELLSAFDDNDEVMSWCDRSTYKGAETYAHLAGLHAAAKEAAKEIARLQAAMAQAIRQHEEGNKGLSHRTLCDALHGKQL